MAAAAALALKELQEAYPAEWEAVYRELAPMVARGNLEEIKSYVTALSRSPSRAQLRGRPKRGQDSLLIAQIRRQMAAEALKRRLVSAAAGGGGRRRFNLVNGYVAQKLLFAHDLERKPVSMFWFRVVWALLWQRRILMPLVEPRGIYCFYSKPLIKALAAMIGDRTCLEIAAGDGTLSRFLTDEGVRITATDDHSWRQSVTFPETVTRQDAREALRTRRPEVVICSWPPAGNPFERQVFRTSSVQLYVAISSRHQFASGNWTDYEGQTAFEFAEDPGLSRFVLPPELESAVYVFRRRALESSEDDASAGAVGPEVGSV